MPFIDKIVSFTTEEIIGTTQYVGADFVFFAPADPQNKLFDKVIGRCSVMDIGIYPIFGAISILSVPTVIKTVLKLTNTCVHE